MYSLLEIASVALALRTYRHILMELERRRPAEPASGVGEYSRHDRGSLCQDAGFADGLESPALTTHRVYAWEKAWKFAIESYGNL